jgi:hypothetical protein
MQMNEAVVFTSKIDIWLPIGYFLLIWLVAFTALKVCSVAVPAEMRTQMTVLTALLLAPPVVLPLWIFLDTSYTFAGNELFITSGPVDWTIEIASIDSITPSRSGRSGPALSLDRLLVTYEGNKRVLISPTDKEAFLAELERRR